MFYRSYCTVLLRALLVLAFAEVIVCESNETSVQSVGKLRASADVAFTNGDIDQALKIWSKVIEMEPKNESNFYRRFRVYLRQQKYREALSDLNSSLNIKADDVSVLQQRAKLQMKMGRCNEAESDFQKLKRYYCYVIVNTNKLRMHQLL